MKIRRIITIFLIIITITILSVQNPLVAKAKGEDKSNNTKILNEEDKNKLDEETLKELDGLYNYISKIQTKDEILNTINPKEFIKESMKDGKGNFSIKQFVPALKKLFLKEISATIKLMLMIIVIGTICALLKNLQSAFNNESVSKVAYFACYALFIIVLSKSFIVSLDLAKNTINSITDFMAALVPALFFLLCSVGGITEAATMDPIVLGLVNVIPRIYVDFIIPLILMIFVLQFVNNISDEYKISKFVKLIKQIVIVSQGILMTVFIGILSIRGITAKTLDAVTIKTAKFAIDNFVPIVGKALSDAVSTIAGYSLILKNSIGTLGLIIIILIVMAPVVKIFLMSIIYKLTGALLEPISDGKLVDCITSAGDSLILIMSCVISISVMCFVMIAIMASAGNFVIGA